MAKTHEAPECIRNCSDAAEQRERRIAALASLAGLAEGPYSAMADEELRDICASRNE